VKATKASALFRGTRSKGIDQSGADDRADAGDRAQAREVLFALGTRCDQRLDSQVEARDELIEARS
jgi:hypothetical protein